MLKAFNKWFSKKEQDKNDSDFERFQNLIQKCSFPEYELVVKRNTFGAPYLQVQCKNGVCNVTGSSFPWNGRKWNLSKYMTDSEVVNTAFKAVLTAVEHETREKFLYRAKPIFGPHMDVDFLAENMVESEREQGPQLNWLEPAAHNGLVVGSSPTGPTTIKEV